MADNSGETKTRIHGNIQKLIQIGTVNGDVLIVSKNATKEVLPRSFQSPVSQDVTDYISVVVKSNRFGSRVQIKVPYDITVSAFIDLVVNLLQLPWSRRIDELLISFDFSYSVIFDGEKLPLRQSLRDAGIRDGDEVQLSITAIWTDEIEKEKQETKDVIYMVTAERLQRRENALKKRGSLTQSKIKALADSCFAFVDHAVYRMSQKPKGG